MKCACTAVPEYPCRFESALPVCKWCRDNCNQTPVEIPLALAERLALDGILVDIVHSVLPDNITLGYN